jgi:hypothetical protein
LHDVVSDILASPTVPLASKRAMLLTAAAEYRDSRLDVTTVDEWREMARAMGLHDMGGPAILSVNAPTSGASCGQP